MGLFSKLFSSSKKNPTPDLIPNTGFTSSADLMHEDQFWKIIHKTKVNAKDDFEKQQDELANELGQLSPDDIILFANRFRYFRGKANTWELWGAIYIIHGGCGDDSFNDFREWVIGQGKDYYYKTTSNPETLIELDPDKIEEVSWEGLGYVPGTAFKEKTGQDLPYTFSEQSETTGNEWEEEGEDLKRMFPKLYAKFQDNS